MGTLISWVVISLFFGAIILMCVGIFRTISLAGQVSPPGWSSFLFEALTHSALAIGLGIYALVVFDGDPWVGVTGIALGVGAGCLGVMAEIYAVKYGRTNRVRDGFKRELKALPGALVLFVVSAPILVVAMKAGSTVADAYHDFLPHTAQIGGGVIVTAEFGILAVWILWSLYFYIATAKGGHSGRPLETILNGVGEVSTAVGDTVSHLVAFVKGGLWLLLGAFVIYVAWPPASGFGWIIFGLGIVAAGKGLSYIGPTLKGTPTLVGANPHGDARDATEAEARQATRGSNRSSVDDRRFRV